MLSLCERVTSTVLGHAFSLLQYALCAQIVVSGSWPSSLVQFRFNFGIQTFMLHVLSFVVNTHLNVHYLTLCSYQVLCIFVKVTPDF